MMTLFWFLFGTAFCIAVSRYNESDQLFWKLFISFIGAFTAATVVKTAMENEKQDKIIMVDSAPTQVLESMPYNTCTLADILLLAPMREKSPKPVSKDSTIDQSDSILSKVFVSARGQPTVFTYFDTS